MSIFTNRQEAGQALAKRLKVYNKAKDTFVLALPRGGVVIAAEVCQQLNLPLDVLIVRKLGVPGHEELAFGSIASGGVTVFNDEILSSLGINQQEIADIIAAETSELHRREQLYRGNKVPLSLANKEIIIIDDGLATGATMRSAVQAVEKAKAKKICIAIPVGAGDSCERLAQKVDELICLETPYPFMSIGQWYSDFSQTPDEEVIKLLERIAKTAHSA